MSDDTHILELLPAYALGCLDADEAILVSEHLAACSVCRAEFQAFQEIADGLALAVSDATPPPELKRRLMERIQTPHTTTLSQAWPSRWRFTQQLMPVWGVVSLLLILVLAVTNLLLWQRVDRIEVTLEPGKMQAVPLTGTDAAPNAAGFIIISADGRNGALVVDKLPTLDRERQYQLWLIRDGQRDSGGVFSVDQDGYGGLRISAPRPLFEYSAVGVSIEPAGGSPGPTGDKVLGGSLLSP